MIHLRWSKAFRASSLKCMVLVALRSPKLKFGTTLCNKHKHFNSTLSVQADYMEGAITWSHLTAHFVKCVWLLTSKVPDWLPGLRCSTNVRISRRPELCFFAKGRWCPVALTTRQLMKRSMLATPPQKHIFCFGLALTFDFFAAASGATYQEKHLHFCSP